MERFSKDYWLVHCFHLLSAVCVFGFFTTDRIFAVILLLVVRAETHRIESRYEL